MAERLKDKGVHTVMAENNIRNGSQEADAYWRAVEEGRLIIQQCANCRATQFYPRVFCTKCGGRDIDWIEAGGNAVLHAFSIVHQPPTPEFADGVPYVTAIVEIEEGPRIPTRIVGVDPDPEALKIGAPLKLTFTEVAGRKLPVFRPARPR